MIDTIDILLQFLLAGTSFWAALAVIGVLIAGMLKKNPVVPVLVLALIAGFWIYQNGHIAFQSQSQGSTIRLATLNVGQFQNDTTTVNAIANQLKQIDADVVLLQEFGLYYKWPDVQSVAEDFAEKIGRQYFHFSPQKDNIFGVAVFSKYPIAEVEKLFEMPGPTNEATLLSIEINQEELWVVNAHLQSFNVRLTDEVSSSLSTQEVLDKQVSQADLIQQRIDGLSHVVIAGDMNSTVEMRSYSHIKGDLSDAVVNAGFGWRSTLGLLPLRIDHIFHSENVEVTRTSTVPSASDHHLVWCDIQL